MWQGYRDSMQYAFTAGENDADRENRLAIAKIQENAAIKAAQAQRTANAVSALGSLGATLLGKTSLGQDIVNGVKNTFKSAFGSSGISEAELNALTEQATNDIFGEIAGSANNTSGDYSGFYDELFTNEDED